MAKIKNKASDVVAEKADVAAHEGPMTILEALKASGKTEPVAVGEIIEQALLEVDSPKDQAKAFSQMACRVLKQLFGKPLTLQVLRHSGVTAVDIANITEAERGLKWVNR